MARVCCPIVVCIIIFFFSSRRRHTRWNCDWSSDVCSSDLVAWQAVQCPSCQATFVASAGGHAPAPPPSYRPPSRSEERRVGKECRSRWSPEQLKKKDQVLSYPVWRLRL